MTSPEITVVRLGTPGPAGSGITPSQWNNHENRIATLEGDVVSGSGTPENVLTGSRGTIYLRTDGVDPGSRVYAKNEDATNDAWYPLDGVGRQRWEAGYRADLGAGTWTVKGMGALTVSAASVSNAESSSGSYNDITTTNTANNAAKVSTPNILRPDWGADVGFHVRPRAAGDITNVRIWVGVFAGDPSGSSTPLIEHAAYRYDDGLDAGAGVGWRAHVSDGATTDTIASGVAVAANVSAHLGIRLLPAEVRFYVNGAFVGSRTTSLPAASTKLAAWVTITTLAAAAKNLSVGYCNCAVQ